jgi:hypothetical protein
MRKEKSMTWDSWDWVYPAALGAAFLAVWIFALRRGGT